MSAMWGGANPHYCAVGKEEKAHSGMLLSRGKRGGIFILLRTVYSDRPILCVDFIFAFQ